MGLSISLLSEIKEVGTAIRLGGGFVKFFRSLPIEGLSPSPVVRVVSSSRSNRLPGYRFCRYSYSVDVETPFGLARGYGESDYQIIAIQKAIAEAIERATMIAAAQCDSSIRSSNGWAAHVTEAGAETAARLELMERDTILTNWFGFRSPNRLTLDDLPLRIRHYACRELILAPRFNRLQVFVHLSGQAPVVSALIHDDENHGFISHATGAEMDCAIENAIREACRLADLHTKKLLTASNDGERKVPDDHALFYAERESFPRWFFEGTELPFNQADRSWKKMIREFDRSMNFSFQKFRCGPLFIARGQHPDMQDLFFGESADAIEAGILNVNRVQKRTRARTMNIALHCVA